MFCNTMLSLKAKTTWNPRSSCVNIKTIHFRNIARSCTQKPLGTRYDESTYARTNVLADYIDKLTNDINMVSLSESDDPDMQCKYVAHFNCIIIIGILIFMFIDMNSGSKGGGNHDDL